MRNIVTAYVLVITRMLEAFRLISHGTDSDFGDAFKVLAGSASPDDPAAKLELARRQLLEALDAIDSLKMQYSHYRDRLDVVVKELSQKQLEYGDIVVINDSARRLLARDQGRLQDLLGITALRASRRGRIVGFASGVVASLVATAIAFGLQLAWRMWRE